MVKKLSCSSLSSTSSPIQPHSVGRISGPSPSLPMRTMSCKLCFYYWLTVRMEGDRDTLNNIFLVVIWVFHFPNGDVESIDWSLCASNTETEKPILSFLAQVHHLHHHAYNQALRRSSNRDMLSPHPNYLLTRQKRQCWQSLMKRLSMTFLYLDCSLFCLIQDHATGTVLPPTHLRHSLVLHFDPIGSTFCVTVGLGSRFLALAPALTPTTRPRHHSQILHQHATNTTRA